MSQIYIRNARRNPLRLDPTRTGSMVRAFLAKVRRQFAELRRAVIDLVDGEDAFGLRPPTFPGLPRRLVGNDGSALLVNGPVRRWAFQTTPQQLAQFEKWLDSQFASQINGAGQAALWHKYVEDGYRKGAGRAFDDVNRSEKALAAGQQRLDFFKGTRDEFLRQSFAHPVSIERVQTLAGRAIDELKGVTGGMAVTMKRVLTDGLVQGKNPRDVARDLARQVEIGRTRAERIARTELIRAHADGQLDALKSLGVENVGVMAEWLSSADACEACAQLSGVVMTITEAQGLIPRHPS